jgi:ABC-type Na+ efflux pump permease subunit
MLKKLIGFEIRFHTRQVGFWVTVGVMFLIGIIMMTPAVNINVGERIKSNGASGTAIRIAALSLGSLFFGAIFVVSGVMRDHVYKSLEIVHSTPISTRNMTLSRMVGVYVATFLCISALAVGLFAGQFMPWMDQEALGPVNPLFYLQPLLVFVAINALLVSGAFTMIAAVTRNRALVYVSAVALFIINTMSGLFVGEDGPDLLVSLIDPFGANALAIVTEFWSADEQNTRLVPLFGYVGLNRLLWGAVGLGLYVATFSLFKRGLVTGKIKNKVEEEDISTGRIVLHSATVEQSTRSSFASMWMRFKAEYFTTVKSIPFIILTLLAVALFAMTVFVQMKFVPDPSLPTSALMAETVIGSMIIPLLIIIVFFSGEIVWRDKTAGMTEIIDASPVRNWSIMAGKWLAMLGILVTLFCVGIFFGMVAQILMGDIPINVMTYINYTFLNIAPRILLLSVLVLFVQNFMPNRVVGMIASAAVLAFFFIAINFLPFAHPLMEYGSVNPGRWSEMNGFASPFRFKWFALYWGSLAALFAVLSIWLWRRGTQASLSLRLKSLGKRISLSSGLVALGLLAVFAGSGGYIYKAYNIDNDFRTDKQTEKRQVKWEKIFGEEYKKPVPKIRSIEVDAMLNPSEKTAVFTGSYEVENTTGFPLADVYISVPVSREEDNRSIVLEGAEQVTEGEKAESVKEFGIRIYHFEPTLAPGEKFHMSFETFIRAPSLGNRMPILNNGTFVNNQQVMPQFGVGDNRLANKDKRRKYGLPVLEKRPDRVNMMARQVNFFGATADYVDFKAKVCTDVGQIPIAPGKMLREYEQDGKICRDYETINPVVNFVSFLSADYTVKKGLWENPNGRDVPLAIYYHETHGYNVDLMLDAMTKAVDTFTTVFGPYQYNQLRIMEFPYRGFAQSFAGTIPFSERIGFVKDAGDPEDNENVDLATYVVMHEIGHQWFGHQIVPANTKGFNVLSEGLTENAAMTAYEAELGWQKARRVLEQRSIQAYLTGRTVDREDEPPLARAEGQQYLDYNKASWVFWGLKQYMGEEVMQGAIRGFLEEYGSKGAPYPTTLQLVEALRAAADPKWHGLITDYWDRITFWKLKIGEPPVIAENSAGKFTVTFTAEIDKLIASEETGKQTSVTEIDGEDLDEWIEVGFYTSNPKETLGDEWMKLERVHITELETELSFTLDEEPVFVLLDPRRLLIERNVDDNVKKIKVDDNAN